MKKIIILCLALCNVYLAYAQEINGSVHDNTKLDNTRVNDTILRLDKEPVSLDKEFKLKFVNPYETLYFDHTNPLGFSNIYQYTLRPDWSYSIRGSSEVWRGISTVNTAAIGLHYSQDRFSANVAAEYWKYDFMGRSFVDGVINADVSYDVLPWFTLGAYAQYSVMAKENFRDGSKLPTPMIPYTNFGGYSKIMFNSTFGIGGSIGRQFNPVFNRWESTYGFGPVIELKKKKR